MIEDILLAKKSSAIPKLTTLVNFNKLDDGYIIISFFNSIDGFTKQKALIETILVDESHAQKIVNTLQEVIDKKI